MLKLALAVALVGHLGQDQFGQFPFVDDDGALVGGGTSWGVVLPDDAGRYGRVCEESFGPVVSFALYQHGRGRVLLGGVDGISEATDGGCAQQVLDNGLRGAFVSAVHVDRNNPAHLLVTTATTASANGVWESVDGGDTFVQLWAAEGVSWFAIAADDAAHVVVSGSDDDGQHHVASSRDRGATFSDVSALWRDEAAVRVLTFDGADVIVGGLSQDARGYVDRAQLTLDPPSKSRVGTAPRDVTQAVVFRDALYVLARTGVVGELLREARDSETGFALVPGGPSDCVFVVDDALVGCGKLTLGIDVPLFSRSRDGAVWVPEIAFADVSDRTCPVGSPGQVGCPFETRCGDTVDNDFDTFVDCADDDCWFDAVCAGEGGGASDGDGGDARPAGTERSSCGAGAALMLGLSVVLRRRSR